MKMVNIDLNLNSIEGLSLVDLRRLEVIVQNTLSKLDKKATDKKLDFDLLKGYYNEVFSKSMRVVTEVTKRNLNKRIKEGYDKSDIKKVIDNASNDEFHEPNNFKHVTLEFLSRSDIFSRYVSEKEHKIPRNKKLEKQRLEKGHTNY
jgi:uncharacterized phage protein (TIGR02220 family)